jgi:hypothetical protein
MKQQARELLVTTKVAQHWQEDFDQRVEELMLIVSKVDTQKQVNVASEMLNVYHNTSDNPQLSEGKKKQVTDRPFEFLVFRN